MWDQILFVGGGLFVTLQLLFGGLAVGLSLGILLATLRYAGIGSWFIVRFVSLVRGTPIFLQITLIYFILPGLLGLKLSVVASGIVALGFNSSAYTSELLRSGIENLPKGQFEAAHTLRIPKYYMWKDIILPQVLRSIWPAMIGEVVALLKETALIATVGGMDLTRKSQILAAEQFTYLLPLFIAGAYYYSLVLGIEYIGRVVERSYAKNF